jgi:PAS domain S-box-containing protein
MKSTQPIALEHLVAVLSTLNQGIVLQDWEGNIVFSNPAAARLLGRPLLDLKDISFDDPSMGAVGEDEKPLRFEQYPAMVAIRSKSRVNNFIMGIFNPALKQRRWFSVDACPIFSAQHVDPSLAYAVMTDVTVEKNADRDLRQRKLHLSLAQRIASIGSAAVDFRTGKWDWSDETFRIYGVERNEFTPSAESLARLVHPDDWSSLYSNVPRARAGIEPDPVAEYRIKRPDGAERIVRRIATAVKDEAGNITGIVATVQDVTDLRIAQRENQALQLQLYHAQRLDSLGTLAGGIAHDLNNTLVPVLALSDAILHSIEADNPNRPLIELISQGGQRASDLVAQILTFARREVIEYEVFDVRTFLQQFAPLIRASIPSNIKIVENLPATAQVRGSQGQLHQVILNLFSNSAHAIGDSPGLVYLSTAEIGGVEPSADSERHFIQITVSDTGCGMTEAVQARMFEPFFTTKTVGRGLGLGLSVAHGIVASHGGHIYVKSAPDEGTRVDILIPAIDD